jgi:hypothetical protein
MSIGVLITVTLTVLLAIGVWFTTRDNPVGDMVPLIVGQQKGSEDIVLEPTLERAFNRPGGIEFSYSAWVKVDDFTTGYGQQRRIFSKGDCPGLYIDSTSNSFVVAVKTYGTTETILVPNIPAKKWIHIVLVVHQESVDIYINGTLRQHHELSQMPQQSQTEPLRTGGAWGGVVADVNYYPRALSNVEIVILSRGTPADEGEGPGSPPRYFDLTWYTGRHGV